MTYYCIKLTIFALAYMIIITSFQTQLPAAQAQNPEINLLSQQTVWQPFAAAFVTQNESSLDIVVSTNSTDELWNRAYLPISINSSDNKSMIFNLQYASNSYLGIARFTAEVRDNKSSEVLWSHGLNNTSGQSSNQLFVLPATVLNTPVEFRLYAITEGPGEHSMTVKKAVLSFYNVTQPLKVESP
jgi:hypothetical protein